MKWVRFVTVGRGSVARSIIAAMFGAAFAAASCLPAFAIDEGVAKQQAIQTADAWLKLLDNGKYYEGYDQAAKLLHQVVKRRDFAEKTKGIRAPLGRVLSRKMLSAKFISNVPNAPGAAYVVIEYQASFEHKPSVVEHVTPMLDKDGKWKVAGYVIK